MKLSALCVLCGEKSNSNASPVVPTHIQESDVRSTHVATTGRARHPDGFINPLDYIELACDRRLLRAKNKSALATTFILCKPSDISPSRESNSTHANNDWLQEAFPQRIFINPIDAAARDIHDGDLVRVWNERGELVIPARVTPRILPGVWTFRRAHGGNPTQTAWTTAAVSTCSRRRDGLRWRLGRLSRRSWWKWRRCRR